MKKKYLFVTFTICSLFFAFAVRLYYLWEYNNSPIFDIPKGADIEEYCNWAKEIIAGRVLWTFVHIHSPLYPFFLAGLFKLFSGFKEMIFYIRLSQIVIVFSACWPIIAALRSTQEANNTDKGTSLNIIFFLFWCWYPPLIYYAGEFTSESLLIFLLSVTVYLFYKAENTNKKCMFKEKTEGEKPNNEIVDSTVEPQKKGKDVTRESAVLFIAAGIFSGLAVITHPISLFFLVAELCYSLFQKKLIRTFSVLFGAFAIIMPLIIYNVVILKSPTPLQANSGFNLYLGNNESADGTCYIRPGSKWDEIHILGENNAMKEGISKDGYFMKEAGKFALYHPLKFIKVTLLKSAYFWNHNELTAGGDLYNLRFWTNYQKLFKWAFGVCAVLALTALMLNIGNFGFYYKYRHFAILLFAIFCANVIFVASARYRICAIPSILVFASWSVIYIKGIFHKAKSEKVKLLVVMIIAAGVVYLPQPPIDYDREKAEAYSILGEAFMLKNEYLAAEKYLTYSLDYNPKNTRNCNLMGIIKEKNGENHKALDFYLAALKLDKNNQYTLMNLAMFFSTHGQPKQAEQLYKRAFSLKIKPKAELYYNYALFCYNTGRKKEAFANYLRCLLANPAYVEALNNLGVLLLQIGECEDAANYFNQALIQDPRNPDRIINLATAEYAIGNKEHARFLMDQALSIAPDFEKAKVLKKRMKTNEKIKILQDSK